jgi:hypothetical protein
MAQRNYVDEIEEIRERTGPTEWDNGITKLFFLTQNTAKLAGDGEKVCYYPVAAIAAMEVYFKWEIRHLIDSNDLQFVDNINLKSLNLQIDHRLLHALHGRRITLGELIAHSARLSSFESICSTMTQLLGEEFLQLVKDARDPADRRDKGIEAPFTIGDADKVIADVKRTFEVRNIICHEAHLELPTTVSEVEQICASCYRFARASRDAISYLCNPKQPLTLTEALGGTLERVAVLDRLVKGAEAEIVGTMPPHERGAFEKMETAWRSYVEAQAEFAEALPMNGSRGVLHGKLLTEEKVRERLTELTKMKKALTASANQPGVALSPSPPSAEPSEKDK